MAKFDVFEKDINNYDKSLIVLTENKKMRFTSSDRANAKLWLNQLTIKTHGIYLKIIDGNYVCPSCNGIQQNTFNNNSYYCPFCGQKVKVKTVDKEEPKEEK